MGILLCTALYGFDVMGLTDTSEVTECSSNALQMHFELLHYDHGALKSLVILVI